MLPFIYDDGGRAGAGYKGCTGDCVVRAIAIATGLPYIEVYDAINALSRIEKPTSRRARSNARTGVHKMTYGPYIESLGAAWTPTMKIGQGCKVHLCAGEIPSKGRLIVRLSKHVAAVIDGELHDTYDCSRDGTRCVYGYWRMSL